MRIGIVVRSFGASARVRALQFVPAWERAGAEVRVVAWDAPRSRAAVAGRSREVVALGWWADVVLLQKPVLPARLVSVLSRVNRRLVVDLDDAVWVSASDRTVAPARVARVRATLRRAAAVVAGSAHLAALLRDLEPAAPPIDVLRPSLALPPDDGADDRSAPPAVVGWIGSPGNLVDLTPEVVAALGAVVGDGSAVVRIVSTVDDPGLGIPVEVVPWSLATEADEVSSFDIGIMPLADDARSAGRCGYKAIQAMAAGRPVVASPVGCAPELVRPGETGFLASGPEEWTAALRLLARDPALRHRLGGAAREVVRQEADADRNGARLLALLADVASGPRWG